MPGTNHIAIAAATLTAAILLTSCGGDDSDEALAIARQACSTKFPDHVNADVISNTDAREAARDEILPKLEQVADEAAHAARYDPAWQSLATAADRIAELVSTEIALGDLRATKVGAGYSSPADVNRDAQLQQQIDRLSAMDLAETFGAECRKTT